MALLSGLLVVELPGSVAASYCGKLLADTGADVIKIEPPEGDPVRRRAGPQLSGPAALFRSVNTGKSSRVVDPGAAGGDEVMELVSGADLLLVGDHGQEDPYGVRTAIGELAATFPSLVITHITPFGASGPRSAWASAPLVQYAMAGWLHITGRPEREPVAVGGHFSDTVPGLCAASASLMALRGRDMTGLGQIVDVSAQEALLLCQPYMDVGFAYTGEERHRNGMPFPMTIVAAADGYLGINVLTQSQWELLCSYVGRTDLLEDPRFCDPASRLSHAAELTELFGEWARDKDRQSTFRDAQAWRIPLGFVPRMDEVPALDQHVARAFFARLEHPAEGPLNVPGVPFLVDGRRPGLSPAPEIGEETDRAGSPGPSRPAPSAPPRPAAAPARPAPARPAPARPPPRHGTRPTVHPTDSAPDRQCTRPIEHPQGDA